MTKRIIKSNHHILFSPYTHNPTQDLDKADVYATIAYAVAQYDEPHPCVFKDENGEEYISSPEADFEIEYCLLILIGVAMPYLIALALWIGGAV